MCNFCNYHDCNVYNMAWTNWIFNVNIYCTIGSTYDICFDINKTPGIYQGPVSKPSTY